MENLDLDKFNDPSELLFILSEKKIDEKLLMKCVIDCTELISDYITDKRAINALDICKRYVSGTASETELNSAYHFMRQVEYEAKYYLNLLKETESRDRTDCGSEKQSKKTNAISAIKLLASKFVASSINTISCCLGWFNYDEIDKNNKIVKDRVITFLKKNTNH